MSESIVRTVCHSHCGGACPLEVHVRNGRITRVETGRDIRACLKGRAYRQRVYAPDRLKYPMRRTGEKGEGKFERVSWDEALDTVASKLQKVMAKYGPKSILYYASVGDVAWLHNAGLIERLLIKAGGCSGPWGTASGEGAAFAALSSYGMPSTGNSREDFLNSRLIILWGWNPVVTCSFGKTPLFLAQARDAGAKIIAIDPRYTDSAALLAHHWIPIRPGTDAAMLVAMAYVVLTEKLEDRSFINQFTEGFERYEHYLLGKEDGIAKTPAWAEPITGVPQTTIVELAREYATKKPAALMDSFAPGRSAYGEQFHRAAIAIASMTANIGIPGTNAPGTACLGDMFPSAYLGPHVWRMIQTGNNPVDDACPPRAESPFYKGMPANYYMGGESSARVNRQLIADAIIRGRSGGYPADYKFLYLVNFNYVNQYANSNKIAKALRTIDFTVIQDQFMTPTAKFSDILLPTNSILERNDITDGGVGSFFGYMNKAIDSLDESKSQFEIATELAHRLNVDLSQKDEEEWLREIVSRTPDIPNYEKFKNEGIHQVKLNKPFVCFREQINEPGKHRFNTASGKIEIYSKTIAELNNPRLPPIPKYIETWESPNDPISKKFPLQVVTTHTRRRAHTQFDNVPWLRELYPQAVTINTDDALARGIRDGDLVRVFNDRGQMIIPARVTSRIMPGVVDVPQGAWYQPDSQGVDRGGCANVLTNDIISPAGAFASNTALAQVVKIKTG